MANIPADRIDRIQEQWGVERPDIDVSPQGVIGRLHRVGDRVREELIALYGRFGLSEGEFDILATLRRSGAPYELAPGEIAAHTMVTSGAVSKRLDRLSDAGLVSRRGSETDRRGRVVTLTAAGRELIDSAFEAHMQNERRLVGVLSVSQQRQLEQLLRVWLHELGD